MKIQKKNWGGGGRGVRGSGLGVRVDVNEELKFFVKIQKKRRFWGEGGGVGVIEKLKFLGKFTIKKLVEGGGGGGLGRGVRGGSGWM